MRGKSVLIISMYFVRRECLKWKILERFFRFELTALHSTRKAGKAAGLLINFHGDELNPMKSGQLGGELEAAAISHLEKVN